jgi:hypothetical protein
VTKNLHVHQIQRKIKNEHNEHDLENVKDDFGYHLSLDEC